MPILGGGIVGLAVLALWIYCLYNVVTTDESDCRNLSKLIWLLIVLFLPLIGSIIWLVAGRPQHGVARIARTSPDPLGSKFPEYDRPGRHVAANPDDDEEFLRQVRERAEEQRRRAKQREQDQHPDDD
jgi:hypothetical protein